MIDHHTIPVFKILMGLFLCVGAYLVVRFFYLGFEYDEIPISKRRLFNRHRSFSKVIALIPILLYLIYLLIQNKIGLIESTAILLMPVMFLTVYEFVFFRPHLNSLMNEAEKLFATLKFINNDAKYNFEAEKITILLKWDLPEYRFSSLSGIKIDRVCKNSLGEYFSVNASTNRNYEPIIQHISIHAAKQLLSKDHEVFIQEFNEVPFNKK